MCRKDARKERVKVKEEDRAMALRRARHSASSSVNATRSVRCRLHLLLEAAFEVVRLGGGFGSVLVLRRRRAA